MGEIRGDMCEIRHAAAIDPIDLDSVRFFVKGTMIGVDEPLTLESRYDSLPPPICPRSDKSG